MYFTYFYHIYHSLLLFFSHSHSSPSSSYTIILHFMSFLCMNQEVKLGLTLEAWVRCYLQDSGQLTVAIPLKKMSFFSPKSLTDY